MRAPCRWRSGCYRSSSAPSALYRTRSASRRALMRYTRHMSTRVNPIRLFVTHAWEEKDDYSRVLEYLKARGTFYYQTPSLPPTKRPIDKENEREDLRRQISPCEVVVLLPATYRAAPDLVLFQMQFAKAADRP